MSGNFSFKIRTPEGEYRGFRASCYFGVDCNLENKKGNCEIKFGCDFERGKSNNQNNKPTENNKPKENNINNNKK